MFLLIGGDICLFKKDIAGIFDFDEFTSSQLGQEFFRELEKSDIFENADKTKIPQSIILTVDELGREKYYLSPISVKNLKNAKAENI